MICSGAQLEKNEDIMEEIISILVKENISTEMGLVIADDLKSRIIKKSIISNVSPK